MAEVKEATRPKTDGPQGQGSPNLPDRELRRIDRLARRASSLAFRARSPFAFMRRFAEEMDHLMGDLGMGAGSFMPGVLGRSPELSGLREGLAEAIWSPRVDLLERDGTLIIRADLPGLSKDDVQVEVEDDMVTIRGERKQQAKGEKEGYAYSECSYGTFYRAMPLPEGADASKATAEFHNGVLEITVPAPPRSEPKSRKLEIREK
ncbi:MAG: Hsp20/alpha crystallin family protein [Isosphaeraceae bacterium]